MTNSDVGWDMVGYDSTSKVGVSNGHLEAKPFREQCSAYGMHSSTSLLGSGQIPASTRKTYRKNSGVITSAGPSAVKMMLVACRSHACPVSVLQRERLSFFISRLFENCLRQDRCSTR